MSTPPSAMMDAVEHLTHEGTRDPNKEEPLTGAGEEKVPDIRVAIFRGRANRDSENSIGLVKTDCGKYDLPRVDEIGCRFSIDPNGKLSGEELVVGRVEQRGKEGNTGLAFFIRQELEENSDQIIKTGRLRSLDLLRIRAEESLPSAWPTPRRKKAKSHA